MDGVPDNEILGICYRENFQPVKNDKRPFIEDLDILPNSPIYISYITKNNLPITEVGLENENKELMAYMTFPKIELLSSNNHIATNFIIRRL